MKFLIIGCGRVGSGLAQTLGQRGHTVTIIDVDPTALERLGLTFSGQALAGSALDRDILLKANIEHADGVATVTGSDQVNVVTARLARQVFHVPRVIARLYDARKAEIYQRLGLQTINPITWGISRIAELLSYSRLDTVTTLGSGEVDLVEVEVPSLLVGRTVNEVTLAGEIHIVAITRGGKTFLPTLGTVFQPGDFLHVALLSTSADRLKTLLNMR
jgi:trk system potassium uptake protein